MSREEMLRRARVLRAVRDHARRHGRGVLDYLDTCARCGDALDERRGYTDRDDFCSTCALALDDARERRAAP